MSEQTEELELEDRLEFLRAIYGVGSGHNIADDDEEYAIFTGGEHADRQFKRVARGSYGLAKEVEKVRLKAKPEAFRLELPIGSPELSERVNEIKTHICNELNLDFDKCVSEELSAIEYHKKVLPLICREALPEGWNMDDVSGYEVNRMLKDFLAGT